MKYSTLEVRNGEDKLKNMGWYAWNSEASDGFHYSYGMPDFFHDDDVVGPFATEREAVWNLIANDKRVHPLDTGGSIKDIIDVVVENLQVSPHAALDMLNGGNWFIFRSSELAASKIDCENCQLFQVGKFTVMARKEN